MSKAAPKGKQKSTLSGRSATMQLYRAVVRYIESLGGTAVVLDGVEFQHWPGDAPLKYRLGIRLMGRAPTHEQCVLAETKRSR